jgi:hypothetical protein
MIDIVVVYDRKSAHVLEQFSYDNRPKEAFAKRLDRELAFRSLLDVEVVLLRAERLEDLKISHARYFDPGSIRPDDLARYSEELRRHIA